MTYEGGGSWSSRSGSTTVAIPESAVGWMIIENTSAKGANYCVLVDGIEKYRQSARLELNTAESAT